MRKEEWRFIRSCSSSGSPLVSSHLGLEQEADTGDEGGVSCSRAEEGELEVDGDEGGNERDSRRDRAPFVGVSAVTSTNRTRLRGVMGCATAAEAH